MIDSSMLELLCERNALVVFVKANKGYSVYVDTREHYNIDAVHFNGDTPAEALELIYKAEKKEVE